MSGRTFEFLKERNRISNKMLISANPRLYSIFQNDEIDGEKRDQD